ncbi:transcriptional regulator, HxlR family [Pedobacter caeni]|uniref:Transcriptional regulator, HxlR family n=2 Tax=Pedobacter caeni TaxID=288992 RepID=A0A1M4V366_9SPHI|nr:transcriptional regulator, HxlR family [Pedobacter caeni]
MAIRDTLDVVGGKWKLVLISVLTGQGAKKFNELSRDAEISPRMLSKELQELETNNLVRRTVCNTKPVTVEYSLTDYCRTLQELIEVMHNWGINHRKKMISEK